MMKRTIAVRLTGMLLVALILIAAGMGLSLPQRAAAVSAEDAQTAEVTGIQVRSAGAWATNGSENFIVLQSPVYDMGVAGTIEAENYNTLSKIRVYLSPQDTEGKLLSDGLIGIWWEYNYSTWGTNGLFLAYNSPADYGTYNGKTIYKITIAAGCELPCGDVTYKTAEERTFYNLNCGEDSAINMAGNWSQQEPVDPPDVPDVPTDPDKTAEVTGVQVRSAGAWATGGTENFIVLQSPIYTSAVTGTITSANYNTLSKIKVYLSEDDTQGTALSDLIGTWWEYSYWGTNALFLAYNDPADYGIYNGATIYRITIEAGCELPCGADVYVTTEDTTFTNLDHGNEECINEAVSWNNGEFAETAVTGVQVRSNGAGTTEDFIILLNDNFKNQSGNADSSRNTREKVRIYMSPEDTEGIYLTDVCGTWWPINYWGSGGLCLAVNNYDEYNGATIYKITIEAGCELPCGNTVYRTTEDVTFTNLGYGDESNKNSAFNWWDESVVLQDFGSCDITNMQNRADLLDEINGQRWLLLSFDLEFQLTEDAASWVPKLNMLDYIYVYLSDDLSQEPVSLREMYNNHVDLRTFGEAALLGIRVKNQEQYYGPNMYMIEIRPGCQFPCTRNGVPGYVTVENGKSFINNEYGRTGEIFGMYDENGDARLYEIWSVSWSSVRKVTFIVEGIEGLEFSPITVAVGDFIREADYAVEGYSVQITDDEGNIGVQGYFVPDRDLTLTLRYTRLPQESDLPLILGLCAGGIVLAAAAVATVLIVRKKRKGDKS